MICQFFNVSIIFCVCVKERKESGGVSELVKFLHDLQTYLNAPTTLTTATFLPVGILSRIDARFAASRVNESASVETIYYDFVLCLFYNKS